MKKRNLKISAVLASLALIFLAINAFDRNSGPVTENDAKGREYVCSMHPQVLRNEPGDCPICGMFLIEVIGQDQNTFDSTLMYVSLPVNQSVPGRVKVIVPETDTLLVVIEAHGVINYDPVKIRTVSARFGGYIEKSFVKTQFRYIRKGQKIYQIYSPGIYAERWNYVKLIQTYPDREDLTAESLQWLNKLGLSKGQIDSLKKAVIPDYHLPVYSSEEGFALNLEGENSAGLKEGITVETGTPLFRILDIRSLRAEMRVKTEYASILKAGQKVVLADPAYPDKRFTAKIFQIEPLNGGIFQTVKATFEDEEGLLLPGRQITARIHAEQRPGLWVPSTAILETGRKKIVMIMHDDRFVAAEVRTGIRLGDRTEILYGIDGNQAVAEKASLLLDSDGFISVN